MARATKQAQPPASQPPGGSIPLSPAPAGYSSAASSEAVIPVIAGDTARTPLPRIVPRPAFVLAWHPNCWIIMAGKLVPSLSNRRIQPGINRVGGAPGLPPQINGMRDHVEGRGWRLIPFEQGPGGRSYLRVTKVDPSGDGRQIRSHYHLWSERYFPATDRVMRDDAGYVAWLQELIDRGVIAPCSEAVACGEHEKALARVTRLEREVAKGLESRRVELDEARQTVIVLRAYIDEIAAAYTEPVESDYAEVGDVG